MSGNDPPGETLSYGNANSEFDLFFQPLRGPGHQLVTLGFQ